MERQRRFRGRPEESKALQQPKGRKQESPLEGNAKAKATKGESGAKLSVLSQGRELCCVRGLCIIWEGGILFGESTSFVFGVVILTSTKGPVGGAGGAASALPRSPSWGFAPPNHTGTNDSQKFGNKRKSQPAHLRVVIEAPTHPPPTPCPTHACVQPPPPEEPHFSKPWLLWCLLPPSYVCRYFAFLHLRGTSTWYLQ